MTGIQNYANLTNMLLSGYSQMNNVRLAQALSNKNTSGMKISQGISTNGKLSSADTEFLKDYQNELLELKDMAEKVMAGGEKSRLAAGAENLSVAEVSGKLASASDKYTLTVEQLASGQVNRSNGLESNSPRPAMSGSIKIETAQGKVELYMSAAGAKDNKEMLNNFASKINAKNIGVTAKVEEKEGKSYLRLEGASGEGNAFSVTGSLAERLGLDRVEQVGQNAIYTVKKNDGEEQRFVSDSNTVTLDGRLKASLKKTGTTNIKAGADAATGIADSVSKLVNKFNETLSFLNKNSDRGIGVLNQMRRMIIPPTSERSMKLAGITINKDGSMKLDRAKFMEKMEQSPSLIKEVVEDFARGIRTDAQMGMQERSGNLLGTSVYSQKMLSSYEQNQMNLMNMYTRSGAYNMTNYYTVGAMMNFNI